MFGNIIKAIELCPKVSAGLFREKTIAFNY
jgi:hypothetical protein